VVLDDLERLRASAATPSENPSLEDGLRIVYEHFLKVLKSRGIEALHALGQPFNPQYHEALYQQPSAEYPAGTVAQELARGYRMYERVLRPARVAVSAGPSAPAEAGQPDAAAKESQE
jgi:molecular chaperone GrpE